MPQQNTISKNTELFLANDPRLFYISVDERVAKLPKSSVPLYQGAGKNYTPELIGTGFPLHIGAYKMLVTARHVAEILTDKQFYIPDNGKIRRFDCRIRRFGLADVNLTQDPVDLAVIDLDDDQAARLSAYHFIELDEIEHQRVSLDPAEYYTFLGYPASKNKGKFETDEVTPHLSSYVGVPISVSHHQRLDRPRETHLGIGLGDSSHGKRVTPPSPHGISGCPVWTLGTQTQIVLGKRTPLFVGMGIENKGGLLIAVRAWLILQLLLQVHPDLEDSLERLPNVRCVDRELAPIKQLILTGR